MRIKKILIYPIMCLMVLSTFYHTSQTYAYWSTINLSDTISETVEIGEWTVILQWDPNKTYVIGDRVINNGITYEAKKNNPTREPGVSSGWNSEWTQL